MPYLALAPVALYLATGAFWWHRIVLPGPALGEPEDWRVDLANSAQRGEAAFLIVKATFVLLWPLVLIGGWLAARMQ